MNNNFTTILYHGHIPTILTDYLKWYEILPLILVNADTKKNIHHPFIRQARRHYKIKDGANLSLKQAEKILVKTRENLGSELVETAILENLDGLSYFNNIKFNQIEYYLNNCCDNFLPLSADMEINQAIVWSRYSLYHARSCQDKYPKFVSATLEDSLIKFDHEYKESVLTGSYLELDSQVKLLVYKTNMPLTYSYIFLRRFLRQRTRTHFEVVSF